MQITIDKQKLEPALYLVATPIGNLKDISIRALETLISADIIACEDTRVTSVLLAKYGVKAHLVVYNDHSDDDSRNYLLNEVKAGKIVVLVSDAGTPLISDPGYKLVKEAREGGLKVFSIPGACAAIVALSVSGLATDKFYFVGFLPKKSSAIKDVFEDVKNIPATLVFYERGSRIKEMLEKALSVLGDRNVVTARELTKRFEEVASGKTSELINSFNEELAEERGEFVVMIEGFDSEISATVNEDLLNEFLKENLTKLKPKALAEIASEKFGLSKNEIYDIILALKNN